jgi:hypothetical protein
MTTICIFAPVLYHALETIGFHFQSSGSNVIFATRQDGDERSEHPWVLQRVRQIHEARSDCGASTERPYWIGFIGNRDPPERRRILKACRLAIDQAQAKVFGSITTMGITNPSLPRNMSRR